MRNSLRKIRGVVRFFTLWITGQIASDLAWEFIKGYSAYLPALLAGVATLIVTSIKGLDAYVVVPVSIVVFSLSITVGVIRDWLGNSDLRLRVCTPQGDFVNREPVVEFWEVSTGLIQFVLGEHFRLTNVGSHSKTIDSVKLVVSAKNECWSGRVSNLEPGTVVHEFSTTPKPVRLSGNVLVHEHDLNSRIGVNYEKAKVELVVHATGSTTKVRCKAAFKAMFDSQRSALDS